MAETRRWLRTMAMAQIRCHRTIILDFATLAWTGQYLNFRGTGQPPAYVRPLCPFMSRSGELFDGASR
jgi:hypothetical protein